MKIGGLEIDIKSIKIEDMPNVQFEDIFLSCGAEVAVKLLQEFAGSEIKVPSKGFKKIERRAILEEYDGSAICIQRMARKFQTTERNIREILKNNKIETPTIGQLGLFDRKGGA